MKKQIQLLGALAMVSACVPQGAGRRDVGDEQDRVLNLDDLMNAERSGDFLRLAPIESEDVQKAVAVMSLGAPGQMPAIEGRLLKDGATVADWEVFKNTWSEVDHHVAVLEFSQTGDTIELRVPATAVEMLTTLRWSAVEPLEVEERAPMETTGSGLRPELSGLSIVTRAQWGARSPRCSMSSNPSKYRMAIHHTEGPSSNPPRQLRAIQEFHANKGWCDVGYHFLISVDGTIYEGRELRYRGVHARNSNTGNIGISHIGSFKTTAPPAAMKASTARLIARLAPLYGISINRDKIKGHREYSSTDCPGNALYAQINNILADARSGSSTPPPRRLHRAQAPAARTRWAAATSTRVALRATSAAAANGEPARAAAEAAFVRTPMAEPAARRLRLRRPRAPAAGTRWAAAMSIWVARRSTSAATGSGEPARAAAALAPVKRRPARPAACPHRRRHRLRLRRLPRAPG